MDGRENGIDISVDEQGVISNNNVDDPGESTLRKGQSACYSKKKGEGGSASRKVTGTKDVTGVLDDTVLNVSSPRNDSSEIPISNNLKQTGAERSTLRNKSETKGTTGDLDDNDINVTNPSRISTEVPNVKKRSSQIQSDDLQMFEKCARTSSTPPTRGRARIPSRGRASYQGRSSVVHSLPHSLPPLRDQHHEMPPQIPNDFTVAVQPVDHSSESPSDQSVSIHVERLKRKLANLTKSYDMLSSNHNKLKVKYEKLETDLLNETVLRKALQMNVESLTTCLLYTSPSPRDA